MSDNLAACIYVHMLGLLKKKKKFSVPVRDS